VIRPVRSSSNLFDKHEEYWVLCLVVKKKLTPGCASYVATETTADGRANCRPRAYPINSPKPIPAGE
jgi:hypothetical protein